MSVVQVGYQIGDRLLRPAMVTVARKDDAPSISQPSGHSTGARAAAQSLAMANCMPAIGPLGPQALISSSACSLLSPLGTWTTALILYVVAGGELCGRRSPFRHSSFAGCRQFLADRTHALRSIAAADPVSLRLPCSAFTRAA